MINPSLVLHGLAANAVTDTINGQLEPDSPQDYLNEVVQLLCSMHRTLDRIELLYKNQQSTSNDAFRLATLYQDASGPSIQIRPIRNRERVAIFFPVQTVLKVNSPGLGIMTLTVQAASWYWPYLPDSTTYALDSTNTSASQNVWVRETNMVQ